MPRRASRAWRALLLLAALLLLFLLLVLTWLLRSGGGRDFALARLVAALPAQSLSWREAEGTLDGPLLLHDLRYAYGGVEVRIGRAEIDWAPDAAFGRRLRIERLTLQDVQVRLPPTDPLAPRWPSNLALPRSLPEPQLPFALQLDAFEAHDVRVARDGVELLVLPRASAAGSVVDGRLQLERLQLDGERGQLRARGSIDARHAWRTDLRAALALPQAPGGTLPLGLVLRGDQRDLTLAAHAALATPARAQLRLIDGLRQPRWTLQLAAPQLAAALLGLEGEPIALDLQGSGDLQSALLGGRWQQGTSRVVLEPSQLRYVDAVLHLEPLALTLAPGRLEATGRVELSGDAPQFDLALLAPAWRWQPEGTEAVVADLRAQLRGAVTDYGVTLEGELRRATQRATLSLQGRGDRERLEVAALRFATPGGVLEGSGAIGWAPQPSWQLDARLQRFDPSWLVADFPGAVDATLKTRGEQTADGARGTLRLDPLGGTLRGRALAGQVDLRFAHAGGDARIELQLGRSRLQGEARWSETLEATLTLQPWHLSDLLPDAAGTLSGRVTLAGAREAPDIDVTLDGEALAFDGWAAQQLQLRARIEALDRGTLTLDAQVAQLQGQEFDTLNASLAGSRAAHRAELSLAGAPARLQLQLQGGYDARGWQGELRQLRIEPAERAAWQLRAPAALSWQRDAGSLTLASSCLGDGMASLCAQLDQSRDGGVAQAKLEALPLATLDPFLAQTFEAPVAAHGVLSGEAHFERDANGGWRGRAAARSTEGGLRLDPEATRELLAYRDFELQTELDPQRATLRVEARIGDGGTLRGDFASSTPLADDGALQGRLELQLPDLAWLELFSDQVVAPQGRVEASITLGGRRAAPTLDGQAALQGFAAELPALGIQLRDGGLRLRTQGREAALVEGEVASGGGKLQLSGTLALGAADTRMALRLRGENFAVAGLPELGALVSPDLTLTRREQRFELRGRVVVPSANINLERLPGATAPSSDVVVVDAERVDEAASLALDSDIEVQLGDKVRLNGFGLKSRVEGRIGLRDRPGRATVARGGLQLEGEYKAYGQDLKITRGRLAYASTPLDNPALDIRAEREIDTVKVGVQVRGTALAPELTLWSEPPLDQAEQLSYLVLGRPMRSATQADGAQLSQAAAAFGGNLLVQKLGARMGLDEVGVSDSRALGGAALTVGKYLSPKLYVSYGVALFGAGQVVTFKYLIDRVWSVQIDSGSENRAAINYRLER